MLGEYRAYCEACQWVGEVRPTTTPQFFSDANQFARLDLGRHYTDEDHDLDGPREDADNINSVGVELLKMHPAKSMAQRLVNLD